MTNVSSKSLAVAGTAGRHGDGDRLDRATFDFMVKAIMSFAVNTDCDRISTGGAAWADHAALRAASNLGMPVHIHIPCYLYQYGFLDTGESDWRVNPGSTMNYYHSLFRQKTGIESIRELQGVPNTVWNGFRERNAAIVASSQLMIAFTFGKNGVKPGGTAHACNLALKQGKRVMHVSLLNRPYAPIWLDNKLRHVV